MLTPAFHYSILNGVYDTVFHKSVILIKNLETETNAEWFDVAPYLSSHTLDVLAGKFRLFPLDELLGYH